MTDQILHGFARRLLRPQEILVASPERSATVADVDRMAKALEAEIEELGVASGSIVGVAAPNGPGFLAALLAVRRRRCAALLYDWRTPSAEKARIAKGLRVAATLDCRCAWPRGRDEFRLEPAARRTATLSPEIAVIKLTSGSAGGPRGILTPSSALVADDAGLATTMELRADERILAALPMSHSYGLSSMVMPALMRRSLLVLAPERGGPLGPLTSAQAYGVTFFPTVPAFLQGLVKMAQPPRLPQTVRLVISAGEPLQPSTAAKFRQAYGQPVHVFYGASECGGITFDRTGTAGERGTVGTPVDGVKVTLEMAAGVPSAGAVVVESPAVASGYHPKPESNLRSGQFRSHDLATFRNGELVLEGRLDDLINVRGKKINPREVEKVLGELEGIEDVAVLGVTPPGREQAVVRSFIVCRSSAVTRESVQAWCRRHLAHHKVPRSIVWLDEIPRTERGKLDRAALLANHG